MAAALASPAVAYDPQDQPKAPPAAEKGGTPKPEEKDAPADQPKRPLIKKAQTPLKVAPRRELIARPGAPRERQLARLGGKALVAPAPTDNERRAFEDMRKREKRVEARVIDKVAKADVYELSRPEMRSALGAQTEKILKTISTAKSPGDNRVVEDFVRAYKRAVIKACIDLLDNSAPARVNALVLLRSVHDGTADVPDAVPVFLQVLNDPKQIDACYLLALKGLVQARERYQVRVEQEREAVSTILTLAARKDVQELIIEQCAVTLGKLGWPYTGNVPERADVATVLANWAVDPANELRTRYEAAVALASLKTEGRLRVWNHELEGVIIARVLRELAAAYEAKEGGVADTTYQWWVYNLGLAYGSGRISHVPDLAKVFEPIVVAILGADKLEPAPLDAWLAAHEPPKDRRLAPRADNVVFPPPKPAEPPEKPAAGGDKKEKPADTKPAKAAKQ